MRRKINEAKAIFDELYNVYKNVKPKCKGKIINGKKKRKKNSLNKLLDTLWSKAVKLLAKERCEYCGSTRRLNSHHIFGRRKYSVRWEVTNGICLCSGHHQFDNRFSAHQTPTLFTDWIKEKRGEQWYEELNQKANSIKPDKDRLKVELETIIYGKPKKLPWEQKKSPETKLIVPGESL